MANQNDSFIDEVSEELRRDRLHAAFRRYGWIVLLIILAIVAGVAFTSWSNARTEARAQAFGDAVLAAQAAPDPAAALAEVPADTPERRAMTLMLAADARLAAGDRAGAAADFEAIAADAATPALPRDLARLKAVLARGSDMDPAARDQVLAELSAPGAPFRLLALEQKAVALIEAGRRDDAVTLIRQIQQEQGLTRNLSERLSQLLVTLGVEPLPGAGATQPAAEAVPAPAPAD
ncbi:hypothetical protein GI374_12435 [Paracoccus sp. S-4012]|uniref:hypothetical protein n=1 Tax=Paracoccus sp. S-4012 TaxID=2665648 RepID=UPI0012AF3B79|nr:hypothetical protein [Paracoccus sp. S-4012]MRX51237.1 hypothetical protein [Paracoccus sp. S-4012]